MKWTIVGVDLSTNDVIDLKDSNFSEANNSIISDFIVDSLLHSKKKGTSEHLFLVLQVVTNRGLY